MARDLDAGVERQLLTSNSQNIGQSQAFSSFGSSSTNAYKGSKVGVHSVLDTNRLEKTSKRERASGRSRFLGWWTEVLRLAISIILLSVIVAILKFYNGKVQPHWRFEFNLNALVALLATMFRITMMDTVTNCKLCLAEAHSPCWISDSNGSTEMELVCQTAKVKHVRCYRWVDPRSMGCIRSIYDIEETVRTKLEPLIVANLLAIPYCWEGPSQFFLLQLAYSRKQRLALCRVLYQYPRRMLQSWFAIKYKASNWLGSQQGRGSWIGRSNQPFLELSLAKSQKLHLIAPLVIAPFPHTTI